MPDPQRSPAGLIEGRAEEVADLLKLLGHPQRLLIACLLSEGEFAVSAIEEKLGIRQPSLSQQLGALREAGVIEGRREAKAVIYSLADERLRQLLGALHQIFCPSGVTAFVAAPPKSRPSPSATMATSAVFARVGVRRAG